METNKEKTRNNKLTIVLILLLALIIAIVFIVKTHKPTTAAEPAEDEPQITEDVLTGEPMDTPIGELIIPEAWADYVEIEDTSAGSKFSKSFYMTVDGKKLLLYEFAVGEEASGYELGLVPDKDGNIQKVWLNISVIDKDSSWSDEQYDEINTIQSGVNDLIAQVYEIEGFQKDE